MAICARNVWNKSVTRVMHISLWGTGKRTNTLGRRDLYMPRILHSSWHGILNKWCSINVSWTKLAKPIIFNVKYWRDRKLVTKSSAFRVQLMKVQASCNGPVSSDTWQLRQASKAMPLADVWSLITVLQGRIQLLAREECETAWRIPLH